MIKSTLFKSFVILTVLVALSSCKTEKKTVIQMPTTDLAQLPLLPKPQKVVPTHSAFPLDVHTAIYTSKDSAGFEEIGHFLAEKISQKTHLNVPVNTDSEITIERAIYINQSRSEELTSAESYQLYVTQDSIIINSNTSEGAFRAVQTLRQMIPTEANDTLAVQPIWVVPSGKVVDVPLFAYRGSMLDVARHFFSVEDVKKYIDIMAYYKMNYLHLHLTDDQGWRIQIDSWPKLTEVGAASEVGGTPGGFFTKADYKEIVDYAAQHHITVIPEVDMPGHTNAASLAYPFLNGNGKKVTPRTDMKVGYSTFDTRKDTVYAFIDDVVREIVEMTPGPYFHIGGDESHVTKKKDYIHFVNKVEKIVQKHGKRMIGWDEIASADVDSTSISQFWSDEKNANLAVKKNLQVIMSPAKRSYLDMKYDSTSTYGLNWAGMIPVDTAYVWNPIGFEGIPRENILGFEAPLWSETIGTIEELEYLAFPRLIGYAEVAWTPAENRDWEEYKVRLGKQAPYLDRMNVKYYPSPKVDWEKSKHTYKEIEKD